MKWIPRAKQFENDKGDDCTKREQSEGILEGGPRIIIEKLKHCNWNHTDAAEQFRIPLSTLNQKIKRLNMEIRQRARE